MKMLTTQTKTSNILSNDWTLCTMSTTNYGTLEEVMRIVAFPFNENMKVDDVYIKLGQFM